MYSLNIALLDELQVKREGNIATLPASRKTRALLAFLILTNRPQRRDRLCEMFWDIPDDPRGALRWSLSKLRRIVNDSATERLAADRERVTFVADDVGIDTRELAARLDNPDLPLDELIATADSLRQPLLGGIDLPNLELFQRWLTSERHEHALLLAAAAERIVSNPLSTPGQVLNWSRIWSDEEPFNPRAAASLVKASTKRGEYQEATRLSMMFSDRFRDAGVPWPPVTDSLQTMSGQGRSSPDDDDGALTDTAAPTGIRDSRQVETDTKRLLARQVIRFCSAKDGTRIAYGCVGDGPPFVKAANWLNHLELDWDAPIWSPLFREFARERTFIRYDERGNGLSDWDVGDIAFETWVTDLETVVDALSLERFPLLGISQGASVSIEYAARHPERVSHLVIFGGYSAGWRKNSSPPEVVCEREAIITLTQAGWGRANPAYRHIFSSSFMPSATAATLDWFDEFQRRTTSPANAARFLSAFGDIDVRHRLAEVQAPTLVAHSLRDQRCPVRLGQEIAAGIPNARFVGLESDGHLLLGNEPAASTFVAEVRRFLDTESNLL